MDGAYRTVRNGLRKRGWVEQDYRKARPKSAQRIQEVGVASDDSDYDDYVEEVYSDEEEYSMMVRQPIDTKLKIFLQFLYDF